MSAHPRARLAADGAPPPGLPLAPPVAPQLAQPADALPEGPGWSYEEKLDGYRVIAFVSGQGLYLQSRNSRPLGRYFPEVTLPAGRFVLDGELVVMHDGRPSFELLQQRVHPAASRVAMLAEQTPAVLVAFDLLAQDDEVLMGRPLAERQARLDALAPLGLAVAPRTADPAAAAAWLRSAEGVVAKDTAAPYLPGERRGMVKVRRRRTMDCVVAGYRPGTEPGTVGALMLGLHAPEGLRVIGHASGFSRREKRELLARMAPLETGERHPGEPTRWSRGGKSEWVMVRPVEVVEVAYEHASGGRIRHGARILRWRDDRDPASCLVDQLEA